MKAAIIYYSLEGNTEMIAKMIAKQTNADLIPLVPEKEIKSKGFRKYLWGGKSVLLKEKPRLKPIDLDLDKYDTLILGTPVWASSYSPPFETFLSEHIITNKSIYLFACHGGGGAKKCFAGLEAKLTENNIISKIEFTDPAKSGHANVAERVNEFCNRMR